LRLCACAFQQSEQIAVSRKDERRIFRKHFPICVHALEEIVELGGLGAEESEEYSNDDGAASYLLLPNGYKVTARRQALLCQQNI
jgi:hypothetical protein